MAYSIGILPKLALEDIENIRKIRNEFAHSLEIKSFNDNKISDICHNFNYNVKLDSKARIKFINVVSALSGIIEGQIYSFKKFVECQDTDLEKRKENYLKILEMVKDM